MLRDVDGSIIRVTSGRPPGNVLQELGWAELPLDFFGDVVAHRAELVAQIAAWTDGAVPADPSEEPSPDLANDEPPTPTPN